MLMSWVWKLAKNEQIPRRDYCSHTTRLDKSRSVFGDFANFGVRLEVRDERGGAWSECTSGGNIRHRTCTAAYKLHQALQNECAVSV